MPSYKTLHIKSKTTRRFRKFARTNFKSQTEALTTMLDFFEQNEISPREDFGPTGRRLETKLTKRTNAIIAIIRNIEKTQTKPTRAMLEALFQADQSTSQPPLVEKKYRNKTP